VPSKIATLSIPFSVLLSLALVTSVGAQHTGGQHDDASHSQPDQDQNQRQHQHQHQHHDPSHADGAMRSMALPAGTLASGTSLEPRSAINDIPMLHTALGNWQLMVHGKAFLVSTQQSGPRGGDKLFSPNWIMPMLSRGFGPHTITFRSMLSLEPATITQKRYPLLFATGETANNLPIVDGQHPHDLFMELAAMYSFDLGERTTFFAYGGPVGEPAIGPPAFPHRSSASENPVAVLGHHYQDSTHIAYSVVTLGLAHGPIQWEASTFHGREPDEERWNIDGGRPDSFATRLSVSPANNWVGQFSLARINSPEELSPEEDAFRMTSSVHYHRPLNRGHWSSSLIWGRHQEIGHHSVLFNSYGFESTFRWADRNWVWTRIEHLDRDSTLLAGETPEALEIEEERIGRVQAYTIGYERDLPDFTNWLRTGLGLQFTAYGLPEVLKPIYGDRPVGFQVFLRLKTWGADASAPAVASTHPGSRSHN
jgi:hypothetical protein